jgi:topoisomerase-4 subunit A
MVLMAQPFSYRYPAGGRAGQLGLSRTTPSPLPRCAIPRPACRPMPKCCWANWIRARWTGNPTFDGTLEEPRTLPARLAQPAAQRHHRHRRRHGDRCAAPQPAKRWRKACIALIREDPGISPWIRVDATYVPRVRICPHAPKSSPRAASSSICMPTGRGRLTACAPYMKWKTATSWLPRLPHQVSGAKVLTQIADQMQAKKLPLVADLARRVGSREPDSAGDCAALQPGGCRTADEPSVCHHRSGVHLSRQHQRHRPGRASPGQGPDAFPAQLNGWSLPPLLTVRRRLQHRLDKVLVDRLHILDGLLIAFLNIDEVIRHHSLKRIKPKAGS